MIALHRDSDIALRLQLDRQGLVQMLDAFRLALSGERPQLRIRLDLGVLKKRRGEQVETSLELTIGSVVVPFLTMDSGAPAWTLGREDIESAIAQLERCSRNGCFSPAEFLRTQVRKSTKVDWVYAEFTP